MDNNDNAGAKQFTEEELNQMSEDQLIDLFVDSLLAEKGVEGVSDEVLKGMHDELRENLIFQVNRAVIAQLPDDKLDELNRQLDAGTANEETMAELVKSADLDTDKIVQETMADFREVYLKGEANVQ